MQKILLRKNQENGKLKTVKVREINPGVLRFVRNILVAAKRMSLGLRIRQQKSKRKVGLGEKLILKVLMTKGLNYLRMIHVQMVKRQK
ncbi:hypothetical protein NQ314_014900 [Rhamnusium bicolor]|uniref:Uncharacterized protein n=1 Tax=Rhamnusium bicolor TaxID=1586634 RepID=A0AAV8X013_9CUCU|nr:hypothetical protein NQ314_014900 [Rhamnusium bicolor]